MAAKYTQLSFSSWSGVYRQRYTENIIIRLWSVNVVYIRFFQSVGGNRLDTFISVALTSLSLLFFLFIILFANFKTLEYGQFS